MSNNKDMVSEIVIAVHLHQCTASNSMHSPEGKNFTGGIHSIEAKMFKQPFPLVKVMLSVCTHNSLHIISGAKTVTLCVRAHVCVCKGWSRVVQAHILLSNRCFQRHVDVGARKRALAEQ